MPARVEAASSPRISLGTSSSSTGVARLPTYETPIGPLHGEAYRKLENLLRDYPTRDLINKLKEGTELLSGSAADINERVYDRTQRNRARQDNRRAKRAKFQQQNETTEDPGEGSNGAGREGASDEEPDEDSQQLDVQENTELAQLKEKVNSLTPRMDAGVRKMIDHLASIEYLNKAFQDAQQRAREAMNEPAAYSTQRTQRSSNEGTGQAEAAGAQAGGDDNDNTQITVPSGMTPGAGTAADTASGMPSLPQLFEEKYQTAKDRWATQALRVRYASSNAYADFRRGLWDAQYAPDHAPPMPKASTWFREEERRQQQQRTTPAPGVTAATRHVENEAEDGADDDDEGNQDGDDDDDIAVALVQVSTTCPLTLREFEDPVTSNKCPHSFEKTAIESLLAHAVRPPAPTRRGAPAPAWTPAVQCPVGGCANMLTAEDLHHDAALVRRIKRIQRARDVDMDDPDHGAAGRMVVDEIDSESGDDIDAIDAGADGASAARAKQESMLHTIKRERGLRSSARGQGDDDIRDND